MHAQKHLSLEMVIRAIKELRGFHPFFGITFLVCKFGGLPSGETKSFPINKREEEFLQKYYKPDIRSEYYFQPFRSSSRQNGWLVKKYPYSGSQSTRTKGDLQNAFIHKKDTDLWGWSSDYVRVLKAKLDRDRSGRIPAFWLAVWIYRNNGLDPATTPGTLIQTFFKEFSITQEEQDEIFRVSVPDDLGPILIDTHYSDAKLLKHIPPAPDAKPEEGGTLRLLELSGVGPSEKISFNPSDRLSIITGDNGIGKTFILECAWWSLTGQWTERQAVPRQSVSRTQPAITFQIAAAGSDSSRKTVAYDWTAQRWPTDKGRPTIPGLIVYARVDGSFAIWDPARPASENSATPGSLLITRDEVLNGLDSRIEGLLRDWVKWQHSPDQSVFDDFKRVLHRLSPPDMMPLEPGDPTRIPNESRQIPTIVHPYDVVPFVNESAGVKRIVTIAYLLVWAWNEHKVYSSLAKKLPQRRMVILVDEMEAHLHPKWQRVVLPALLDVTSILSQDVQPQLIVATHSPLVLASVETVFSERMDSLFHLQMDGNTVLFNQIEFIRYGSVDAWLTSPVFELRQPRSREGETALETAKIMMEDAQASKSELVRITEDLKASLGAQDTFWPRWLYFIRAKGVEI